MDVKKVYIIVLNWNGTADTIECLESLKTIDYSNYQIIVIDNNSKSEYFDNLIIWCGNNFNYLKIYTQQEAERGGKLETEQIINSAESSDKLVVIRNNENLGFAAGNNVGLKYILTKKNEKSFALLLNNDTVVQPDFLSHLMAFMDKYSYAACTPQIRYYQPNDKIWNCGGKITWFGNRRYFFAGENIDNVPKSGFRDITFVTGCSLLFQPKIIGLLSEKFFFGEEDFEFSLRLRKQKLKMACVYESIIYHKVGNSIDLIFNKQLINKAFLFYTSRLIDHKQYFNNPFLFFIHIVNLFYVVYLIAFKYKQGLIKGVGFAKSVSKYVSENDCILKEQFFEIMNMNL